ncbi:MAG: cobalamin-dependent protein [Candidatus Hodarchaeota archaeon]
MKAYDVIFIHPPRQFKPLKNPLHIRAQHLAMPMGLFSMADYLDRNGYSSKIINYSLEKRLNPRFSLHEKLKEHDFKVIAVDLHWINHCYGAMEILKLVKNKFPNAFTLLGGFSSSFYAKQILDNFEQVDGIIRGEAEVPIVELVKNLDSKEKVSNLMYRDDGKIRDNGISFISKDLDDYNFSKVKYVDHWKEYVYHIDDVLHLSWMVEIARGCPQNCMFCGGGSWAMQHVTGRKKFLMRSPERVIDDIKEILDVAKIKRIYLSHGIFNATKKFHYALQKLVRDENIEVGADLEAYRLPVEHAFIKDFANTYTKEYSMLWFSVRSFSESFRKKMRTLVGRFDSSFNFTDKDLDDFLKACTAHELPVRLFWDIGYPFENIFEAFKNFYKAMKLLIQNIPARKYVSAWTEPIITSPASPVERYCDELGLKIHTKTFIDYYKLMKYSRMRMMPLDITVNYRTSYFTTLELKILHRLTYMANLFELIVTDIQLQKRRDKKEKNKA